MTRWSAAALAAVLLAGCVTFPGDLAPSAFVPRLVDREYDAVWKTVLAALRNEGALVVTSDREEGLVQTAFRTRPGTKVRARGLVAGLETRNPPVQVRYEVRARPLGAERTEVALRIEVQYQNRGSGLWVPTVDDGGVAESFWRRFQQDLAYYGARPETWPHETPRGAVPRPGDGSGDASPGREAPRPEIQ